MCARSSISPMIGFDRSGNGAQRHREEHRKHHDLQDLVLRHRIRDRGRDQMVRNFSIENADTGKPVDCALSGSVPGSWRRAAAD